MRRLMLTTGMFILLSNLLFAGRYYDAEVGRFLTVDPLATKYPSFSPYNYTVNNPLKNIDPDGRDVVDAITGKPVKNAAQMTKRARRYIRQMMNSANREFLSDVLTTGAPYREDLRQPFMGGVVNWGGSYKNTWFMGESGYGRFTFDTKFTLFSENKGSGWKTAMTASPGVEINPALTEEFGKSIYQLKFGGTIFDSNGNSRYSDNILIITGTVKEINEALTGTGYEIYEKDKNKYELRKIEEEKKDEDENKN